MTTTFLPLGLLMLACGIGIGLCLGYMIGLVQGRAQRGTEATRVTYPPGYTHPLSSWADSELDAFPPPPAPEPTDFEDFEQRTRYLGPDEIERAYARPAYRY